MLTDRATINTYTILFIFAYMHVRICIHTHRQQIATVAITGVINVLGSQEFSGDAMV